MGRFAFLKTPNNMMIAMIGTLIAVNQLAIRLFPYNPNAQSVTSILSLVGIFTFSSLGGMMQREKAKDMPHLQNYWSVMEGGDGESHIFLLPGVKYLGKVIAENSRKYSGFVLRHEKVDIGKYKSCTEHILIVPGAPGGEGSRRDVTSLFTGVIGFHGRDSCCDYGTEIGFNHPASARISTLFAPLPDTILDKSIPVLYLVDAPGLRGDPYANWSDFYGKLTSEKTQQMLEAWKKGGLMELEQIQGAKAKTEEKEPEGAFSFQFSKEAPHKVEVGGP